LGHAVFVDPNTDSDHSLDTLGSGFKGKLASLA